jgi:hypothetical protein
MGEICENEADINRDQNPGFPAVFLLGENGISRQQVGERKNSNQAFLEGLATILGDASPDARWMKREFRRRLGTGREGIRRLQPVPGIKLVVDEHGK